MRMGACRMAQSLFRPRSLHYASETEGVMCQRQSDRQEKWRRAAENREYVRRLLADKQPAFAAALRAAERQLDWELSARRSQATSVRRMSPRSCSAACRCLVDATRPGVPRHG